MRKRFRILSLGVIILSMLLAACSSTTTPVASNKPAGQAAPAATISAPANATPTTPAAGTQLATSSSSSLPAALQADLLPADQARSLFSQLINSLPASADYGYIHADVLNADLSYANKPYLLDVRDPSDISANGYILGAVNIPLKKLLTSLNELPTPNTNIIIYSNTGYRSGMALAALMLLGYTNVHDLDGGLDSWIHNYQFPVVTKQAPPAPQILNPSPAISDHATYDMLNAFLSNLPPDYYQVDASSLTIELHSTTPPTLIDMNTAADHQQYGQIPGAVFIPYANFFDNADKLPGKSTPIVIYSVGGAHSSILLMGLYEMGYMNVHSLKGGVLQWKADNLPIQAGNGG